MVIVIAVFLYFTLLFAISRWTSRRATNATFYRADRRSPWYMVAFGMVGASISGVTFVSVPGMVLHTQMTYLQMCMGFILGYVVVAFVLLPLYYRLNLTSIYGYLAQRLGRRSYKTGASFFLLSNMVLLIWLYTRHGGIKTLVWTDSLQTLCLFTALLLIIYKVTRDMGLTMGEAVAMIKDNALSQVFVMDDWLSKQYFWKQFLSGVFIVLVMTGVDQDMMQKNLTCKTLRGAQKDMCTYGVAFLPANLLFLSLGVLLTMWYQQQGMPIPTMGDDLLPNYIEQVSSNNNCQLSIVNYQLTELLFVLGIVAASFSSADSALTSLTTIYCVDIKERASDEPLRKRVHLAMCGLFVLFILLFKAVNSTSLIDAVYIIASYTYGPLLGLFAYGLLTHKEVNDRWVPYIAIASPLLCYVIDCGVSQLTGYRFGYELLMLNALFTFVGLAASRYLRP